MEQECFVSAIDVGTTKICVLIARVCKQGVIDIIGMGKCPSDGLRRGVVVDITRTIYSIKTAIKDAEIAAGRSITPASVGVSGAHISSLDAQGAVPIRRGYVTDYEIASALAAARAIPIKDGQHILHTLPQFFLIDGQDQVYEPLGMHGVRLEVNAHIILGAIASVQNLVKACQTAGATVSDIVLEPIASAYAVLSDDEKNLGIAMLDIGGGTSDFVVYQNKTIRYTNVFPIAGNLFTSDLAIGLHTTIQEAENLKREHGLSTAPFQDQAQSKYIHTILSARAYELCAAVHEQIHSASLYTSMPMGIVLTGGGSLLIGLDTFTSAQCHMPVRIGRPRSELYMPLSLAHPMYATGCGLLLIAAQKINENRLQETNGPLMKQVFNRMKSWVFEFL